MINPAVVSLQLARVELSTHENVSTAGNSAPLSLTAHSGDNLEMPLLITAAPR